MHIELLWIIPIIAFAFFIFLVVYLTQRGAREPSEMTKEVRRFNSGFIADGTKIRSAAQSGRLGEIENAISLMTQSLTNQQKMIDKFQQESQVSSDEINDLKKRLREMQKEYDIILSENYSLRARLKKVNSQFESGSQSESLTKGNAGNKVNMKLYDDTKLLSITTLEDTSEIDLANVK